MRVPSLWFLAVFPGLVCLACGPSLRSPPYAAQPASALVRVGFPPPPARVERVPPSPRDDAVWIDGEWAWQGRGWSWQLGRWVVPPAGGRFSPWTATWGDQGAVYYASGTWRDANGDAMAPPDSLATAKPGPGLVIDPSGEQETTGAIRHVPPAGARLP